MLTVAEAPKNISSEMERNERAWSSQKISVGDKNNINNDNIDDLWNYHDTVALKTYNWDVIQGRKMGERMPRSGGKHLTRALRYKIKHFIHVRR